MSRLTDVDLRALEASIVLKDGSLRAGTKNHINHLGCPAGADSKKRLYGSITEDGTMLLAYCHHCGGKGAKRLRHLKACHENNAIMEGYTHDGKDKDSSQSSRWDRWLTYFDKAIPLYGNPSIVSTIRSDFPLKYFVTDDELDALLDREFYGMRATPEEEEHRLIMIPRMGEEGVVGIDARATCHTPLGAQLSGRFAKWNRIIPTTVNGEEMPGRLIIYNHSMSNTAVICEDPISAMKIDLAGYAGVAITGSNLSADDAFKLSILYKTAVVWLDNDNPTVTRHATAAVSRLKMFGVHTAGQYVNGDPKRFHCDEITRLVHHTLAKSEAP